MKTRFASNGRPGRSRGHPRREQGMAVIVVMALMALVLIYLAAHIRTLRNLGSDLRLIEQQQKKHWQKASGTNAISTSALLPRKPTS